MFLLFVPFRVDGVLQSSPWALPPSRAVRWTGSAPALSMAKTDDPRPSKTSARSGIKTSTTGGATRQTSSLQTGSVNVTPRTMEEVLILP